MINLFTPLTAICGLWSFPGFTSQGISTTHIYRIDDSLGTLANGNLWISCSIWDCQYPTIESLTSLWTWPVQQLNSMNLMCPLILQKNLFTTTAVDNLDHNPSSTTAHGAFHGTGISLFQNRVSESDGIMRHKSELQPGSPRMDMPPLSESYTTCDIEEERPHHPSLVQ